MRARTMLAEASVAEGLVNGCSYWWRERRAELIQRCDGGGAIGRRCCVAKRCCWVLDSVVMVVAMAKSRFGRPTLLIEARCWSRLAWKETGGVVERCCVRPWSSAECCNTVLPPGVARMRGECWSVAASGGGRKAYSAGNINVRRWGMSAYLSSGACCCWLYIVVEERVVVTML